MLINRLIKMYGLRHKHIRIEDQQSNLKINIIVKLFSKKENIFVIPIELSSVLSFFCKKILKIICFYKLINYLAK